MFKKGYKQTEEHTRKMREAKKGKRISSYGIFHSEEKKCISCNNIFYPRYGDSVKQWQIRIFCSRKCRYESQKGKPSNRKGKKYPSRCGEKNNLWKGGITPLYDRIRQCWEYNNWRTQIFGRDNFTCQHCGVRGTWLEAHHIKEFAKIIKENSITSIEQAESCQELWDVSNGITYCKKCHDKLKKKGGLL